jgi:hypothetical protein
MQLLTTPGDVQTAIFTFAGAYRAKLPSDLQSKFDKAGSNLSFVDNLVNVSEALYANLDGVTDATMLAAARTLIGQLSAFGAQNGFHQDPENPNRRAQMAQAMQRDLGEAAPTGMVWPDQSDDPKPLAQWAPTPVASLSTALSTAASGASSLSTSASTGFSTATSATASLSTSA